MFLSLQEMELRKVEFDQTFPPGEIHFLDQKLRQVGSLQAAGSAELLPHSNGDVRIQGHLAVKMEAECERCLEAIASYPLDVNFDLFYAPVKASPEEGEVALDSGATEMDFYQGDGLELEDVLREQILLALPMQKICTEECRGICPACGQNRNLVACGCQQKAPDDRWAALRDLKPS
jgi:uncharacterized protein